MHGFSVSDGPGTLRLEQREPPAFSGRMSLLPFGELPPHQPRRFVPVACDLGDWPSLAPLFDQLEARAAACRDAAALEAWLLDWSELSAACDEEGARRYIAMTCHTADGEAERAYLRFVEEIEPQMKPRHFRLEKLYLDHPQRAALPAGRYDVFDRTTAVHVELFREENVPLETKEAQLSQQYQKLSGSLTVQFREQERTLTQMARFLEEPDRPLREEAWVVTTERRLRESAVFEQQFEALFGLRQELARNAGYDDYVGYAFRRMCRFDYAPADCLAFHTAVEQEVVPLVRLAQARRRQQMGLEHLRPWDTAVDPLGRPPLRPFQTATELLDRTQAIFDRLDPGLADAFQRMQSLRLLDLENRKGKAPGGYQYSLAEARLPFVFMNAVGVHRDVETLLHEAGHAFHALATRDEPFYPYRSAPIEFCEVASMSMELLGQEFVETFYTPTEAQRARREHLEGILKTLAWIAQVDAFQHWLYRHSDHTEAARDTAWLEVSQRFAGDVDWRGHERALTKQWHRQLHIFLHPFYYIEYGIAQLGALQIWANYRRDPAQALAAYRAGLRLGGSRPLPELFAAAACRFDFSAATLRPLVALVRDEWERL